MAREILMPKMGLTMVEGKVVKWHVEEGDKVNVGDRLFDVETDKLTNTINADVEGIVRKILVSEGETVPVKELIAIIADEDENIDDLIVNKDTSNANKDVATKPQEMESKVEKVNIDDNADSDYVRATPYAKKVASDKGIDLSEVNGTGYNGVIVSKDVFEYEVMKPEKKVKATPVARKMAEEFSIDLNSIDKEGRISKSDIYSIIGIEAVEDIEVEVVSNMRKIIAERMKENWNTIPMVTYNMEADMSELISLREKLKPIFESKGLKFTFNHLIMKITTKALMEFRELNSYFDGNEVIYHNYVNMGLAVAVGDGLLVPNVKNINSMSLLEIAEATENLISKARNGELSVDDLQGGTFTITNIGMFGMDSFTPIINKPEVGILGLNRIYDKPVVVNKEIVVRPMMNMSLTTDHSIVDGAKSAKFLKYIKDMIENPYLLIL